VQEDLVHVFMAIVEGLDDHLQWPDVNSQKELACIFLGILRRCIGVADVKEFQTEEQKDSNKERKSWSEKAKINSYEVCNVIDHTSQFIYLQLCLGRNDREVFTCSPLYLFEGDYFSVNKWVFSYGAFDGDGRFLCPYKNPGNNSVRVFYNLAFQ
jgi:hypothetical protein